MIVAVTAMRVMQVATDKIVNMVTVWYHFMPTCSTVSMATIVTAAVMIGCAGIGIDVTYGN
jgi:hypothetical protein